MQSACWVTFSTLMSGWTAVGWKVISSWVCWLGAKKPEAGKAAKCGPRAVTSSANLVPTSPLFST